MELMTPSGGTIFWTVVTFIFLLIILRKVAWKPILQTLDEREKRIRDDLAEAENARIAAQKTLAEQANIIDAARKEAQEIIGKSRKAAESAKGEIIQKANSEAEHLIAKAKREIELSRDKAIEEIRDLAVELSMSATTKLIGKSLDQREHKAIINDSLKKMGDLN
jgi:F-type H+-transporting ATPase subunit b